MELTVDSFAFGTAIFLHTVRFLLITAVPSFDADEKGSRVGLELILFSI